MNVNMAETRKRKLAEVREARARPRQPAHSEGLPGYLRDGPEWALHLQHSVLFTRGEIAVHAEPIHLTIGGTSIMMTILFDSLGVIFAEQGRHVQILQCKTVAGLH